MDTKIKKMYFHSLKIQLKTSLILATKIRGTLDLNLIKDTKYLFLKMIFNESYSRRFK